MAGRSESARQREVHRYYQPWLDAYHSTEKPTATTSSNARIDRHVPRSSKDRALTAFAQLACLRLNVKRAIVTLIATSQQYVLAEATKTLSLRQDGRHNSDDELWFGNAVFPRSQGISEYALDPEPYVAQDSNGLSYTAPAFVVNDISEDTRFRGKLYSGKGIKFYAGVPIKTKNGHSIGVYTITDDTVRHGLSASDLQFLHDMAEVVLDHLESTRNDSARNRGERMVRGLGSFIEGRSSYTSHSNRKGRTIVLPKDAEVESPLLRTPGEDFKGMTISDANQGADYLSMGYQQGITPSVHERQSAQIRRPSIPYDRPASTSSHSSSDTNDDEATEPARSSSQAGSDQVDTAERPPKSGGSADLQRTYKRAANILREAMAADGVLFFDASSAKLNRGADGTTLGRTSTTNEQSDSSSWHSDSSSEAASHRSSLTSTRDSSPGYNNPSASGELRGVSKQVQSAVITNTRCKVLGLSLTTSAKPDNGEIPIENLWIAEQDLKRCIRRYPNGKVFLFGEDGELSSSDPESSIINSTTIKSSAGNLSGYHYKTNKKEVAVANALLRVLPKARNIVFLPLWDFSKERWSAGAFIWSTEPKKLLNARDDLSYIKAFGNSIMNEISRLHILSADQAKASFLANISHELRSPLHGILGSVEFLQETAVDAFQSGLITSVETCGKTLLDTVEHVLDYTKINQSSFKAVEKPGERRDSKTGNSIQRSLVVEFDMAVVVEEVVEAVFAGQTFRSAEAKFPVDTHEATTATSKEKSQIRARLIEGSNKYSGSLNLTLDIEPYNNWRIISQPGAIRRITMNLLGNALKYTEEGAVNVQLKAGKLETESPHDSSHLQMCLTIRDTGRGMSEDFLQNHVFTPFTQEDSFASGTGLGLSIVKQIVRSLGGRIDIQSRKDVGTEVKVWLTLPTINSEDPDAASSTLVANVREETTGLAMYLLEPEIAASGLRKASISPYRIPSPDQSISALATEWFHMKVSKTPSMKGVKADFFIYVEPPPIEYLLQEHGGISETTEVPLIIMCTNTFEAATLRANGIHQLIDIGRIIEIISQPCGPQKLARALNRCLRRLQQIKNSQNPSGPMSSNDRNHLEVAEDHTQATENLSPTAEADTSSSNQNTMYQASNSASQSKTGILPKVPPDSEAKNSGYAQTIEERPSEADIASSPHQIQRTLSYSFGPASPTLEIPTLSPGTQERPKYVRTTSEAVGKSQRDPSEPIRVLVVDDNPINLQLLVTFMKKTRTPHASASNGLMAVNTFKSSLDSDDAAGSFTHVLMDINMPVMDGLAATREIRRLEREREKGLVGEIDERAGKKGRKQKVVIWALTGLGDESVQRETESSGMDGVLTKPIGMGVLRGILGIP